MKIKTASLQHDLSLFSFILAFVSAAVISPFMKRLFTEVFYTWLKRKGGIVFGMAGSSFIFMLVHIPTYNTLPVNFFRSRIRLGVRKTKSLLPSMIIHACFNGIAVILTAAA